MLVGGVEGQLSQPGAEVVWVSGSAGRQQEGYPHKMLQQTYHCSRNVLHLLLMDDRLRRVLIQKVRVRETWFTTRSLSRTDCTFEV